MAVSKFHKHVRDVIEEAFADTEGWKAKGWPDQEMNLAHLCGCSGASFADFYISSKYGAFVVEVHSTLHNKEGIGAWGGDLDDHEKRMGRDDVKKQYCGRLGIEILEIWPRDSDEFILDCLYEHMLYLEDHPMDELPRLDRYADQTSIGGKKDAFGPGQSFKSKDPNWKPQKLESKSSFQGGNGFRKR